MTELRCDRVVELVTDFLDGALDDATEQDLVEHLTRVRRLPGLRRAVPADDPRARRPAGAATCRPRPARPLLDSFRRSA